MQNRVRKWSSAPISAQFKPFSKRFQHIHTDYYSNLIMSSITFAPNFWPNIISQI